jgi:hypothetical protein
MADKNNQIRNNIAIDILQKNGYKKSEDAETIERPTDPKQQAELLDDAMGNSSWVEMNID